MPTTRKHPKRVHKSEAKGGKEREEVGSIRVAHKSPLFQKPPEPEVKCVFLDIVERSSPIRGGLAALSHVTVGRLECGSPQSRAKQPNYTRREIRKQPRRPQRCGSQPFSEPNDYPSNREHEKKKEHLLRSIKYKVQNAFYINTYHAASKTWCFSYFCSNHS